MIWHILVIVFGALTAVAAACPFWGANVLFGVLIIIFGVLALVSCQKQQKPQEADVEEAKPEEPEPEETKSEETTES